MTDKNRTGIRSFTVFRSYFEMTEDLAGDDAARLRFYDAVFRYVFKGETPDFSDQPVLRMAWRGIEPNLDTSINRARPGNANAAKTQPKRDPKAIETPRPPEDKDKNKDKNMDKNMDMEEESVAPSSPDVAAPPRENPPPNNDGGTNFKRWDAETFRSSVRAEVEADPDFAAIEAAFCDYWLESDPKGRPRFRLERTWSTAGRLRSWLRREEEHRCFRAGRTSASAGADRNAIGGLARNCLAGLPASETFRPRHAFLDTTPTGPRWSDHETGENFDLDKLFM